MAGKYIIPKEIKPSRKLSFSVSEAVNIVKRSGFVIPIKRKPIKVLRTTRIQTSSTDIPTNALLDVDGSVQLDVDGTIELDVF